MSFVWGRGHYMKWPCPLSSVPGACLALCSPLHCRTRVHLYLQAWWTTRITLSSNYWSSKLLEGPQPIREFGPFLFVMLFRNSNCCTAEKVSKLKSQKSKWRVEDSRKAQHETYFNHIFAFYHQEGAIHHNILWMSTIVHLFLTGEIVIVRNNSCLVKNKMVEDIESVYSSHTIRTRVFYPNHQPHHLLRKL